jgi:pimeloyl-ACP methyl ester carboxylesterase
MNTLSAIRTFNTVAGRLVPSVSADVARKLLMTPRRLEPREWELPAAQSAERINFRFGLSGLRWGRRGDPVVLMLHGWEGRPTQFRYFIEPLLAGGRQVVALDAPAHGESLGEEAHPLLFAMALHEAVAEIPELEAVVGHSMGAGATALALAEGLPAERAVLIAGPASIAGVLQRFGEFLHLPPPAARSFVRRVEGHTGVPVGDLEVSRLAQRLHLPALIVHDRNDTSVPFSDGEAIAHAWPSAEFLATQGLGHWNVLKDPQVVNQISRFLLRGHVRLAA